MGNGVPHWPCALGHITEQTFRSDPIQSTYNWLGVRATAAIAPGDAQPGGAIAHGLTQLPCGSGHVVGITTQGRVLTIRVAVQHTDIVMLEF